MGKLFETFKRAYQDFKTMTKADLANKVIEGWLTVKEYQQIVEEEYIGAVPDQSIIDAHHLINAMTPTAEQNLIMAQAQQNTTIQQMLMAQAANVAKLKQGVDKL